MAKWKRWFIAAYIAVAVLIAWPLNTGMFFHESRALWLSSGLPDDVIEQRRLSLFSNAVVLGGFYAVLWPLATPIAFCLTGFAEHGVFTQSDAWRH